MKDVTAWCALVALAAIQAVDERSSDPLIRIEGHLVAMRKHLRSEDLGRVCLEAENARPLIEALPVPSVPSEKRAEWEELRWQCVRHCYGICEAARSGSAAGAWTAIDNLSLKFGSLRRAYPRG